MNPINPNTLEQKPILGIGNALVDVLINIPDDAVLQKFGLLKGSMTLVDATVSAAIKKETHTLERIIQTGGSAANTIHGIAQLGGPCGYLGKISDDEMGRFFLSDFQANHIHTHFCYSPTGTGHATALVSRDSERTFGTYLGAALELTPGEMDPAIIGRYGIMHIEGYLVQNHELIEAAMKTARELGLLISIDMASFNIVEANLEFLHTIIRRYVDIVFANEEEALALTGRSPLEALDEIAQMCSIAVVKLGAQGSVIKTDGQGIRVDAIPAQRVDTTGAGDV